MLAREWFKVLKLVKELSEKEEVSTIEEVLDKLAEEFGEKRAIEIFNTLRLTGTVRLGINNQDIATWELTNRGRKKFKHYQYIFNPSKAEKEKKHKYNLIIRRILEGR